MMNLVNASNLGWIYRNGTVATYNLPKIDRGETLLPVSTKAL